MISAGNLADGDRKHLDISAVLPPVHDAVVRVDSLASEPESWRVHLRAEPGWWIHSADGNLKATITSVAAEDDLGGLYLSNFGGSRSRPGYEEVKLTMRPRLAPGARLLKLTFASETQQVTAEIPLAP